MPTNAYNFEIEKRQNRASKCYTLALKFLYAKNYMDMLLLPLRASKIVFASVWRLTSFIALVPVISFLAYLIPAEVVPSNSISFQMQLMEPRDYVVVIVLATLESLLLLMFYYVSRKGRMTFSTACRGNGGVIAGIPALFIGLGTCSSMALPFIFGFLGTGFVAFAGTHASWIFTASLILLLAAIYSLSRKVLAVAN